jgi:hypothetical protein
MPTFPGSTVVQPQPATKDRIANALNRYLVIPNLQSVEEIDAENYQHSSHEQEPDHTALSSYSKR